MKKNLHQQPLCHPNCQRENHIGSLEPVARELPLFAKEGENGLLDLTQSSDDEDSATVEAATCMPNPTEFFLPESSTTSVLQTSAAVLGSVLKADQPYKKKELDQFFTTIIGPNPQTNPFNIFVPIKFSANSTDPPTLASCIIGGNIRPVNKFIWPFTGISLNDDGSFNIHGPKMHPMELAIPNAMISITS